VAVELHRPVHPVRFITAASLFDGHDAAINIMRRILQSQGAEVIHLGHNRSVDEVVEAAVAEDVQGVAVSCYQGGHVEFFGYLVDRLAAAGAGHIRVYGGGGGVIVAEEIAALRSQGVRIFSPEDGQRMGLAGMVNTLIAECDHDLTDQPARSRTCSAGPSRRWPARSPCSRPTASTRRPSSRSPPRLGRGRCPCSESPAPAARASPR